MAKIVDLGENHVGKRYLVSGIKGRMKEFTHEQDAYAYSTSGGELVYSDANNGTGTSSLPSPSTWRALGDAPIGVATLFIRTG